MGGARIHIRVFHWGGEIKFGCWNRRGAQSGRSLLSFGIQHTLILKYMIHERTLCLELTIASTVNVPKYHNIERKILQNLC